MIRILFICHGNICRSTMAQSIFSHLVSQAGVSGMFEIDSAATSTEEIGNPMYPPAVATLQHHEIPCVPHLARRVTRRDYQHFDHLVLMDHNSLRNLHRIIPEDPQHKVRFLLPRDVADPWYTGDFEITYRDLAEGCSALLERCLE